MMQRLHEDLPFMEGEVAYATKFELAEKPNDVIVRRLGIGIIDRKKAEEVMPKVVDIMGEEHNWTSIQKTRELEEALHNLEYVK